jgi:ribosomal protein L22
MAKTDINGKNTHDVFKYLRRNSVLYNQKKNVVREVPWNFTKFLVSGDGKKIRFYNPRVNPVKIAPDIKKYLDKLKKEGGMRGQDFDARSGNLSDLDVPSQDPSNN